MQGWSCRGDWGIGAPQFLFLTPQLFIFLNPGGRLKPPQINNELHSHGALDKSTGPSKADVVVRRSQKLFV